MCHSSDGLNGRQSETKPPCSCFFQWRHQLWLRLDVFNEINMNTDIFHRLTFRKSRFPSKRRSFMNNSDSGHRLGFVFSNIIKV